MEIKVASGSYSEGYGRITVRWRIRLVFVQLMSMELSAWVVGWVGDGEARYQALERYHR